MNAATTVHTIFAGFLMSVFAHMAHMETGGIRKRNNTTNHILLMNGFLVLLVSGLDSSLFGMAIGLDMVAFVGIETVVFICGAGFSGAGLAITFSGASFIFSS